MGVLVGSAAADALRRQERMLLNSFAGRVLWQIVRRYREETDGAEPRPLSGTNGI